VDRCGCSATATPSAGIAPLEVALSAAATDADGDTLTYSWDFDGDGTEDATGATASRTFTTAGTKTVTLTVRDGKTGTATNGEDRPPNAWFTAFAPADQGDVAQIAVAVIVLDGGDLGNEATGGQVSAPIARAVIDAYL